MTTHTSHSTPRAQITLAGQTATPPGPLDMSAMYLMHHAFRRDLDAFVAAVNATPVEDRACWAALAGRWAVFAEFLHHHHSGEDAGLWPALLARVGADDRRTLVAMEAEHAQIDPLLAACDAGFRALAEHPDHDVRAALAVRLVAGRERLAEHLRHEESEAIPLLQRHLTSQEWDALQTEHFRATLPWRRLRVLVPWALEGVPADVRRHLFAGPGGGPHRILWQLTRRGFARRSRLAFRYRDRG